MTTKSDIPAAPDSVRDPRPVSNRGRRGVPPVALIVPAFLFTIVLTVIPVGATVIRVITDGGSGVRTMFDIPNFGTVMANTAMWTGLSVVGALLVGYAAALLLQSKSLRLVGLWRSLVMIPWIIPGVVGATIWRWTLSTDYGILNGTLLDLHIIGSPIAWLSNPDVVLYAVAVIQIWVTAPFATLMVSAALAGIPAERYEASRLDGATSLQILRFIVLPGIRATSGIVVLTLAIWALNSFTIIWVSTSGGPAGASTILPILLYQAFQNGDESLTAAVAVLQLLICAVFAVIYVRVTRTDVEA